jgi:hypothetical protein
VERADLDPGAAGQPPRRQFRARELERR